MYAREFGPQTLTFGVSGMLYKDALIMFDRETDNLWTQIDGRSIEGSFEGRQLSVVPAIHATWKQWKRLYPESQVLRKSGSTPSAYAAYNRSGDLGIFGRRNLDARLDGKERILGVVNDGTSIAFRVDDIRRAGLVQVDVGAQPIVLIATSESVPILAYDRTVTGRTLTFEVSDREALRVRDVEAGTLWDIREGLGTEGPLAGQRLRRVAAHSAFWYGWRGYYPATDVWMPER